ncbi:hypothetical protein O4J56_21180 [Nocardiopsis sp. RSe5-2]|uniref:DUF320 domain-containing protein n=1 Tax=Nocardiopsis endophytica TaxID=3018445 RepID=A0ABT4U883_9ACTN|nr:hypothetical protein [Nocardiopsis endophytica]MDA2813172.1 hypothetical protein [Nocardiopsis endophytica]
MLRKITVTGAIVGAAAGAVLMAAPAQATDQEFNSNLQGVPAQVCNANVGAAIGFAVPVLSPQSTGACTNGAISTLVK